MTINPNTNQLAIAYDDSRTGDKKFAQQSGDTWTIETIDNTLPTGGGYTSLAYEPFKSADKTYHSTLSYYDSTSSALKFARWTGAAAGKGANKSAVWDTTFVATAGVQGLYSSLYYDRKNQPNILFFKKTNTTAYRAAGAGGAGGSTNWTLDYLGTGGREIQSAISNDGTIAYTNLDSDGLRVELL
jgi:hypothetical protein